MLLVNMRQSVMNIACTKDTDQVDQNERKKNKNTAIQAIITFRFLLKKSTKLESLFMMLYICRQRYNILS